MIEIEVLAVKIGMTDKEFGTELVLILTDVVEMER